MRSTLPGRGQVGLFDTDDHEDADNSVRDCTLLLQALTADTDGAPFAQRFTVGRRRPAFRRRACLFA